ncbi:MAG: DUF2059 domain-containing protein [Proteobacteria bacterium]|nr:DUF2059 domain-containing protein [Pseudomonadota bacterium]
MAVSLLVLASSAAALAQTAPPPPVMAPAISPHARELSQQLLDVSGADPRNASVSDATLAEAWAAIQRANPGVKPELRPTSDQATREEMKSFADRLYAGEVDIYARHFTEAQLTDLIAFYKSPTGQTFVRESASLGQERNLLSRRLASEILSRIVANFCGKAACPSPTPPAAPPPAAH